MCEGCGRADGDHRWWCQVRPSGQPSTGGVLELCSDCGEVIVPYMVAFAGNRYRIAVCERDPCVNARIEASMAAMFAEMRHNDDREWSWRTRFMFAPVVNNPTGFINITGI